MEIDWKNKEFDKKLLSVYNITEDPLQCGWILPDGRMLDFQKGAKGYVFAHFSIEFVTNTPRDECIEEFNKAGAIRHTHSQRSISIMKKPTSFQIMSLAGLLKMHYKADSWISGRTQLGMTGNNKDFFKRYPIGHNPGYIINDIKGFF